MPHRRSLGSDLDLLRAEAIKRLKGEAELEAPKKKKVGARTCLCVCVCV